ncbi:hypothetical protein [Corynebacterium anserum]|uniref:Uncharacterized protein n=1 Tax=Corynebacterium anserum TaxID=2684406 RepID=A0A7G7YMN5_9CORY|nr:hypothetical protein [Corynebacterium anserum]MBC2681128.1 hypothetical protein [Corynebacterium anserum]QNH95755.1 hypothetical protein GP473_02850 [Corynebacterium anserum]
MRILSYWPYIVYLLSGLLFIAAGSHPAWMLVPLTCACIGGSVERSRVESAKIPEEVP